MQLSPGKYKVGLFNFNEGVDKTTLKLNSDYKEDDVLFFMGNWPEDINKIGVIRRAINCNNIYFLYGNKDLPIRENITLPNLFWNSEETAYENIIEEKGFSLTTDNTGFNVEVKDLFNQCSDMYFLDTDYINFVLSNYPLKDWKGKNEGVVNFFNTGENDDIASKQVESIIDIQEFGAILF